MVIRPRHFGSRFITSSDYRKPIALDTEIEYRKAESLGMVEISFSLSPRFRLSNKLFIVNDIKQEFSQNDIGYVPHTDYESIIFMGLRNVSTLTNTIDGTFSFTTNAFVNLRVRHYWSWVDYSSNHTLNTDGSLSAAIAEPAYDRIINFSLFNVDLTYQWYFAPVSVLSVVWKNVIENSDANVRGEFFSNFNT